MATGGKWSQRERPGASRPTTIEAVKDRLQALKDEQLELEDFLEELELEAKEQVEDAN